ncbi:MAG TPA: mechanosensitive ion channel family protein [Coleofasciculaceae cyanobacterium]
MISLLTAPSPTSSSNALSVELPLASGSSEPITSFLTTLVVSAVVAFLMYVVLFYVLRLLFRRLEKDVPLVFLSISRSPILAIFTIFSLKLSFEKLGSGVALRWIQQGLTACLIIAVTYWVAQLFAQIAIHYLKAYARTTEAVWDDLLIPILERVVPLLTYLVGISFFLQTIGIDLTGIGLALGSITVVLGLAVKDIISDFFSGLVLLIDTPFQFGDVISLDGSMAVIKNIGIRVTKLYLVDTNCEVYTPNSALVNKDLVNLSRPTPHYAYSINIGVRVDADLAAATKILRDVVLGHPDTLGNLEEKLQLLENFSGLNEVPESKLFKRETSRVRILAEKEVNRQLKKIEEGFADFTKKIKAFKKGGLNKDELKILQNEYLEILKLVGLHVVTDRQAKQLRARVEEDPNLAVQDTLIGLIREWYQAWLADPDLVLEDQYILPDEWEQKLEFLQRKMNKLYQKIFNLGGDEARLDNYATELVEWMHENFKESQTLWKEPKVRLNEIKGSTMEFTVKFYVDNIKLEHWERGYRVSNEVRREMIRRLRQAYIYSS